MTRRRSADRGTVKLIDARAMGTTMRKPLGDKRKELLPAAIAEVGRLYGEALSVEADEACVKVLPGEAFGLQRITVERPLRRRWEVMPEAVAAAPFDAFASLVGQLFGTEKALPTETHGFARQRRSVFTVLSGN